MTELTPLERSKGEVLAALQELVQRYAHDKFLYPDQARRVLDSDEPLEVGRQFAALFNVGPVRRNTARCLECDAVVESTNRHDFSTCGCGATSVDGGTWYLRRSFREAGCYEELSSSWPWALAESV